jgi:hypothetical protein
MSREKAPKVEAGGRKRLVTVGRKQLGANCPKLIQDVRRLATTAATKSLRVNCPERSRVWPNNRDRNVSYRKAKAVVGTATAGRRIEGDELAIGKRANADGRKTRWKTAEEL